MRSLILTLLVVNPEWVKNNKITIIKFIRRISSLGLKESKDLVEATVARENYGQPHEKFFFKVVVNKTTFTALLSLNNSYNSLAALFVEVYEAPKIYDLREGRYYSPSRNVDPGDHSFACDCFNCKGKKISYRDDLSKE